jgi:class 3 adenylate cyclase/DNA-binding CsgD family transcriptional regulator/tetratricopeptide (TPR) repeat protein
MAVSRRVQTLLFTDIVGSTDRLRELGDAAWAALLVRYHGVIRAVLAAHGGREVDTAGDGFLARFDAPGSAVQAAVAAVAAVAPLQMEIRAGLHTGEVELDGDAMTGIGVHLAARVMGEAGPGQVLVSATVRELMAGSGLGFVDLGVRELKGFAERWRLFALDPATVRGGQVEPVGWEPLAQGRGGPRVPFSGLVSMSPTFVGRAEELQILEGARRRAAGGEPAVVLVGGEAGVGKTRLVAEFTARCVADGTRVLAGGCVPVGGDGLPYAPVVEALRRLPEDFGVDAMRELAGRSWRELARVLPSLGKSEAGPLGQVAQPWLFELLLGLLGRLSEQMPVALVVEDLHWADQSTRDLLAFLVRNLRQERVLLVVTYRTDEPRTEGLGPWLAELDRAGRVHRLELSRLDRAETAAQLTGILDAAPAAELVESVFVRSEGNPFFSEELLAVVRGGSRELPATIRDLLRGRVAGLSDPARQALSAVAVAGRRVPHRLLAAVVGLDDQQLIGGLRAVISAQLLVTTAGQDGYDVRHALLREVVDADLLPGERMELHAGYARALSQRPELTDGPAAVLAAELAVHWDAAGEPTWALPARVDAGQAAERSHAFPEALHHYKRALELWGQVPEPDSLAGLDRVELLTRAADAATACARADQALVLLTEALDRVASAADPMRTALVYMRLGGARWDVGDEPGCLAALDQAVRILPAEPSVERARILAYHAQWLMWTGRYRDAVGRSEQALAVARTVGARAEEGHALAILGRCTADAARVVEARQIAEAVGDAGGVVRAHLILGLVLWETGQLREALAAWRGGIAVGRELGWERVMGALAANLAWVLLDLGAWTEVDRVVAEGLERETRATSELPGIATSELHAIKGMLEVWRGDFQAAREHLELARRLHPPPALAAWLLAYFAELALWEGRYDDAGAAVDQAVAMLERVDPGEELSPTYTAEIYALGLWVEADRAEVARAARSADGVTEARRRAGPLLATLQAMASQLKQTEDAQDALVHRYAALGSAESSRLEGRSDPERWAMAAQGWERLEMAYRAAYARFREAEALLVLRAPLASIEPVIQAAHETAVALGAAPLRREIELLAQRGRLRLEQQVDVAAVPEAPPSPAASLGLTRRETEVLALVAAGRTNRQIGQALFITEKTASLHVSHILTKLGAAGRGEAAAIAHRLGLDKQ